MEVIGWSTCPFIQSEQLLFTLVRVKLLSSNLKHFRSCQCGSNQQRFEWYISVRLWTHKSYENFASSIPSLPSSPQLSPAYCCATVPGVFLRCEFDSCRELQCVLTEVSSPLWAALITLGEWKRLRADNNFRCQWGVEDAQLHKYTDM